MATSKRDYYEVLGISRTATDEEVKKAYRRLARQYHPDVNKDPNAETHFKEINEAYEILSDGNKRAAYDRFGHAATQPGGFPGGFDPYAGGMGGFGVGDIFETLFSTMNATAQRAPQRGSNIGTKVTLEFEEAVFGSEKEVEVSRFAACQTCSGSGAEPGTEVQTCPQCKGTGEVRRVAQSFLGSMVQVVTCDKCHGEGKIISTPCHVCKGEGRVHEAARLVVKIPAGVDEASQIRLAGEGDAGIHNQPAGDLYINLGVKPHKLFRRKGNDLHLDWPINVAQAALGDELDVPTLEPSGIVYTRQKIAPGTQHDKVIRLRDKGVPYLRQTGRGDLHVHLKVMVPTTLTDEQHALFEQLARSLGHDVSPQGDKGFFGKIKDVLGG